MATIQEAPRSYDYASSSPGFLEHDPEKREPVFGKDHAQTEGESGMPIQLNLIPL
jgi:hypothetical protein